MRRELGARSLEGEKKNYMKIPFSKKLIADDGN